MWPIIRPALAAALLTFAAAPNAIHAAPGDTLFFDDFESGAPGWNATGLWNLNADRAASAPTSWYYGRSNASGTDDNTYDNGVRNFGVLSSPPIDLTSVDRAKLSFWTWWEGEGCPYEHPIVRVQRSNGTNLTLYDNCDPAGQGELELNITPFAGDVVRVLFAWDTKDATANFFEGWYVDDVRVTESFGGATSATLPDLKPGSISVNATAQPIVAGDPLVFRSVVTNLGGRVAPASLARFLVDGALLGDVEIGALETSQNATATSPVWIALAGEHNVHVVVDPDNEVTESNETNNVIVARVIVAPGISDLAIDVQRVEKVPIRTDYGDVWPHPREPHRIAFEVCNNGTLDAPGASVVLTAFGGTIGSSAIANETLPALAIGACEARVVEWDAYRAVGDVRIVARATSFGPERALANNADEARSFVFAGEMGGVVV